MTCVRSLTGTGLALVFMGCAHQGADALEIGVEDLDSRDRPVAIVTTESLQSEGEQGYILLYADGTASGLVVVYFDEGLLYGTNYPESWTWLDQSTVEVCGSVRMLRNEVGFPPMERDCGTFPVTGKELDLDGDGDIDLVETFTILHPSLFETRPVE